MNVTAMKARILQYFTFLKCKSLFLLAEVTRLNADKEAISVKSAVSELVLMIERNNVTNTRNGNTPPVYICRKWRRQLKTSEASRSVLISGHWLRAE